MSRAVFAADSIGKRFGDRQVLKAATVMAYPGRVTVVLGRNGSGKSTLLKCAVGLVALDDGAVHFAGKVHTRPRLHRLARDGLFYLPERGLLSRLGTVGSQLDAVQWSRHGVVDRGQIDATLDVGGLLAREPGYLSTGERRRVEVAAALLREPVCLLADEPLQGIAPIDAERIAGALRRLAERGCAILVTGHEVPTLLDTADDVVWVTAGTTCGLGSPAQALAHDQFRREYLVGAGARRV